MKGSVEKGDKSCFIVFEKLRGKVQGNIMNYFSAHKQNSKQTFWRICRTMYRHYNQKISKKYNKYNTQKMYIIPQWHYHNRYQKLGDQLMI